MNRLTTAAALFAAVLSACGGARSHTANADDVSPLDELREQAAGDADNVYVGSPEREAWVDLHYTGVRRAPGWPTHLIGDTFFEAQAHAQRAFWARQRASK